MNCWSANPPQTRLKVFPEGSCDFQLALEESFPLEKNCDNGEALLKRRRDGNNNSNTRKLKSRDDETLLSSLCCFRTSSSSHPKLESLHKNFSFLEESHNSTLFPGLNRMGTTCSSNAYDSRDWYNVADGCPAENVKPNRRSKKKQTHYNSEVNGVTTTPACTCTLSSEAIASIDGSSKTVSDRPSWLSAKEGSEEVHAHNQQSNRLSPSVDSSGHIKLSRVFTSGRARATSSCDVSPHRLLTRRNNSPSGRSFTFDSRTSFADALRQRSHSWSNGRYGSRPNYLKPAPSARSSMLSPPGQHKLLSPNSIQSTYKDQFFGYQKHSSSNSKVSTQEECKKKPLDVHDPSCPLHTKTFLKSPEGNTFDISVNSDTTDPCLSPVMRHRSASESHTSRPRRLLPRTPGSEGQDHVHVRWADEEDGSSLSTSVFLSSIRPRSYSYGAADSVPHRPILKKVAGL
ncbi:hypothetical protein Bpfe_007574 [Biomphalaria pfeifferi]|uniref:Uncharacterized protein n=1 Tax=Biomphalaria pfeifferi TaxID=112525 RepID=A0AAD8FH13_BIOPF|nr:hypothetical protein Bpfe_007574 [Biomphalaria pfeifferi]